MITTKLKLKDSENKTLGTISGINPDATTNDVSLFIEGVNGFRNSQVAYAYMVTEAMVYMPQSDD